MSLILGIIPVLHIPAVVSGTLWGDCPEFKLDVGIKYLHCCLLYIFRLLFDWTLNLLFLLFNTWRSQVLLLLWKYQLLTGIDGQGLLLMQFQVIYFLLITHFHWQSWFFGNSLVRRSLSLRKKRNIANFKLLFFHFTL